MRTTRSTPRRLYARAAALAAALVLVPLAGLQPAQAAATHVDNPFVGATGFVNPLWKASVESAAQAAGDATLAAKMRAIENTSTAVWMDRIAAVNGTDGGLGLAGYLDAALSQQQGTTPETVIVVVYDLPGRDCNALASNGELPATQAGLNTYKTSYVDPIAAAFAQPKYESLRIVAIIEPDSLPNITTNSSVQACATAAPFYEQGVAYALDKLHAIPNVYTYLDSAHAGWLGWPNNSSGAVQEFLKVANMTAARTASIDGFITDTANTTPLKEPFFQGSTNVGGTPVMNSNFYEFNPDVDEAAFTADMYSRLVGAGFPAGIGMLVDTSRNGWGGSARPTQASTSTNVETFVTESRVDRRPHRGAWCNQNGAGIGERPVATPAGYPSSHLDAFVWVKPPGESDGASQQVQNDEGKGFDRMCDPTYVAPNLKNQLTNALPNAPLAGHWFPAQFTQLVQNAFPVIGGGGGDTQAPSAPANLSSPSHTASSVSLTWTASTDNVGVTGYQVFNGATLATTVTGTSATVSGLAASTAFTFTVRAVDAAGNVSAASNAVTVTTSASSDTTPPGAPTNLSSPSHTASSVSLTWTASTDNVGVTGYQVFNGSTLATTVTGTSATVSGLAASTSFTFTVRAVDAAGNVSAASNAVTVTTSAAGDTTPPTAPTNLSSPSHTSSSVSLSWTASTDNVGVTGYRVFNGSTLATTVTGTTATVGGLAASTSFTFTVRATDAAGNVSAASNAVTVTTDAGGGGGGGSLKAQYRNYDSAPGDNQIKPGLQLVNTGATAVSLTGITVRYWFTRDAGASTFSNWCDYAQMGCNNVARSIVLLSPARAGADAYLQVSFTAGTLAAGASTGDIQLRLNKTDWSAFTEPGDYSYAAPTGAYADSTRVTVYQNGTLVWGVEP